MGCFTEGTGGRALAAASYPSDTNTIEACVAACSPYQYAGAEYGRECWCADSFGAGSVIAPDSDCSMTCAGDQYEYCGAGNRLSVYIRNGTTSQGTSSSSGLVSSSSKTSTSSVSSSSSKSLSSTSTSKSVSSTSTLSSSSTGATKSSTVSSTPSSSKTSTSTSTSTSSSSSSSLTNPSKLITTTKTSTSSSVTPTQTAPAIKTAIGNYTYLGCQTEASNTRALSGAASYNYTSMTLEMCSTSCSGWKYWGVEYGGECYCGNAFNAGSVSALVGDCSFACPGDQSEYCGAGNRLSAYVLKE